MDMHIDEPGQQIHSGAVNFSHAFGRSALLTNGRPGRTHAAHVGDAIVLHHHIDRPTRRCTRAIDDSDAANHQPVKGPVALVRAAIWRGIDFDILLRQQRQSQCEQQTASELHANGVPLGKSIAYVVILSGEGHLTFLAGRRGVVEAGFAIHVGLDPVIGKNEPIGDRIVWNGVRLSGLVFVVQGF